MYIQHLISGLKSNMVATSDQWIEF